MKKHYDLLLVTFVFTLLVSNLLSGAKLIQIGAVVFDAGLLLFPVAYVVGDILTEVYGYAVMRRTVFIGFVAYVALAILVYVVQVLPAETYWSETVGDAAYTSVLSGIYGLLPASISAYVVGSLLNARIVAAMRTGIGSRYRAVRFMVSTLVGQFADTLIFFGVAVLLGVFPVEIVVDLILFNYAAKVLIEAAILPISVWGSRRLAS